MTVILRLCLLVSTTILNIVLIRGSELFYNTDVATLEFVYEGEDYVFRIVRDFVSDDGRYLVHKYEPSASQRKPHNYPREVYFPLVKKVNNEAVFTGKFYKPEDQLNEIYQYYEMGLFKPEGSEVGIDIKFYLYATPEEPKATYPDPPNPRTRPAEILSYYSDREPSRNYQDRPIKPTKSPNQKRRSIFSIFKKLKR